MRAAALVLAIVLAVACGGAASRLVSPSPSAIAPTPTPASSATPSPARGGLTEAQLKYRLIDGFGPVLFCDPDFYPVARADEQELADRRFGEIQQDGPTFMAILTHLGLAPATSYTPAQRVAIYRDWKMLNALPLQPVGAGFHFVAIFVASASPSPTQEGTRVDGTIDQRGTVTIASKTPSGPPPCPICLARGTLIATPGGEVAVEDLRVGDLVWTQGPSGSRVVAPLAAVGSTPVPPTHQVVRLALSDGRTLAASPGHPAADGRRVGDLVAGERFDGSVLVSVERLAYNGGATFDVLPAGATGTYWANGVLLGSTLR